MKDKKDGREIPPWMGGAIIAVLVIALAIFGFKYIGGAGPRDPSTYPKEAYRNPYSGDSSISKGNAAAGYPMGGNPQGQSPAPQGTPPNGAMPPGRR